MAEPEISFSTEAEPWSADGTPPPTELDRFLETSPMIVSIVDRSSSGQIRAYVRVMRNGSVIASFQRFTNGDAPTPLEITAVLTGALMSAAVVLEGLILR